MVRLDTRPGYRRRVPQRLLSRHRKEVVAHALGVLVDPVHLQRGALGPRAYYSCIFLKIQLALGGFPG